MQTKNLPLADLVPDPKQPRKYFDEQELAELALNIKGNGILQPLLVRPHTKYNYMIVCGERRYRAAHLAQLTEVPVVIKEMTDEQALQAQITENLLRHNVNAMEEAMAIKSLHDVNNLDYEEIAARLGKDNRFVKQRLKLNDLIEDFQFILLHNKIKIKDAIALSALDATMQKLLYKERVGDRNVTDDAFKFEIANNQFENFRASLVNAPFDITDGSLYKTAGACTMCQFNSNNALLFETDKPTCGKPLCFKTKSNLSFNAAVEEAATTTNVIYVDTNHKKSTEAKEFEAKTNNKVLVYWEDFNRAYNPEAPDKADYDFSDPESKEEYDDDYKRYIDDLNEHAEGIANGTIVKGFVVAGTDKGKWIFLEPKQNKITNNTSDNNNGDDGSINITAELESAKYKLQRTKEIAENNILEKAFKLIDVHQRLDVVDKTNTIKDELLYEMIPAAIYKALDWSAKDLFEKHFNYSNESVSSQDFSILQIQQMLQFFVMATLPTVPTQITNGNTYVTNLCLQWCYVHAPVALEEIEADIMPAAEKKIAKLQSVIENLQPVKKSKNGKHKATAATSAAPAE